MTKRELEKRVEQLEQERALLLERLTEAHEVALRILQQQGSAPATSIPWYPPVTIPPIWCGDQTNQPEVEVTWTSNVKPGEGYRYTPRHGFECVRGIVWGATQPLDDGYVIMQIPNVDA